MTDSPVDRSGEWFDLSQRKWTEFPESTNPMLIREIRRMLKGRTFAFTFLLLLIGCWATCLFLLSRSNSISLEMGAGREFCNYFFLLLLLPNCFVVPLSLFSLASEEHSEQTLELLTLSTLSLREIFSGYFWCGAVHAGIYYAAVVPFICFSYLLRGVGLFNILFALIIVMLYSAYMMYFGMMLGACAAGPIRRSISVLLTIGMGLVVFMISSGLASLSLRAPSVEEVFVVAIPGVFCSGLVLVTVLLIISAFGVQQFRLVDPLLKPYLVRYDKLGNLHFQTRYGALSIELEESLQQELLAPPASRTPVDISKSDST